MTNPGTRTILLLQKIACAILLVFLLSCSANNDAMEIRYTSVNDFNANYVFHFKDDAEGLKQLYEYALKDLQVSKRYRDSMLATGRQYNATESLPLKAEPVVFYKPPGELEGQPDSTDMLLSCTVDEDAYVISDINVPSCMQDKIQEGDWTAGPEHKEDVCSLQLKKRALSLCVLKGIMDKIKTLQYHKSAASFMYQIMNADGEALLTIAYTDHGKNLKLLFPGSHR